MLLRCSNSFRPPVACLALLLMSVWQSVLAQQCKTSAPLGMITGSIQDWQITASSTYPLDVEKNCHERYARLYQPNGFAWCAKFKSNSEWLQVDLGVDTLINGVAIQGRSDGREWVSAIMISYSQDSFNWKFVADINGGQRVFDANEDAFSVNYIYLDTPINARFVKFHVVRWNRHPSMRIELFGCQECRSLIGYPPFGRITASSQQAGLKSCSPDHGNILSNRAWCAKPGVTEDQWLQFDVGPPTQITGVVTKGRGDTKRKQWVTKYRIAYSNDSLTWTPYKDAPQLNVKSSDRTNSVNGTIFAANVDKDTERFHYLNQPFVARFVRLYPLAWNAHMSMRAGVLGCPFVADCGPGFMRINPVSPCVPNLAYRKEASALNRRSAPSSLRRVSRENSRLNVAARAGEQQSKVGNRTISQQCTTLQTYDVTLTWTVNLSNVTKIRGAILQLPENSNEFGAPSGISTVNITVSETPLPSNTTSSLSEQAGAKLCTSMTLYGSGKQSRMLMQCKQEVAGRYVYLEIAPSTKPAARKMFSFTLCDLSIF